MNATAHCWLQAAATWPSSQITLGRLVLFFVSNLSSSLNGTPPKPATCSEVSAIWNCMSEIWCIPSTYKSLAQTHFFRRLRNLMPTLTAYILGMKHYIHNRARALTTTMGLLLYNVPIYPELWSTNGFKLDRHFYPLYVNSAFYFIARLRRRRLANGTQPNFAKWWIVNRANNVP